MEPSFQLTTSKVEFSIEYSPTFGNSIYLIGNVPALGSWNPSSAVKLKWNEVIIFYYLLYLMLITHTYTPQRNIWTATIDLPINTLIEYKYICASEFPDNSFIRWEEGSNRQIRLNPTEGKDSVIFGRSVDVLYLIISKSMAGQDGALQQPILLRYQKRN